MLADINRFRRTAHSLAPGDHITIEELLEEEGYSKAFGEDYLYPMTGAIWSARQVDIRGFPARSLLDFLANHGLIDIVGRPSWRTVEGGSREYVARLTERLRGRIRTAAPVSALDRGRTSVGVRVEDEWLEFDQVVFAVHTDQALAILGDDARHDEIQALKTIEYQPNVAILHSDTGLMPATKSVWSSWNALASSDNREHAVASVTYWMNRLQGIDESVPLFVSLNPATQPDPRLTHATFEYAHPQFRSGSREAQLQIAAIQGENRTWYAGAWLGYGFHEDGLQSGFNVAAALGSPPSWMGEVSPMSSAPQVVPPLRVP